MKLKNMQKEIATHQLRKVESKQAFNCWYLVLCLLGVSELPAKEVLSTTVDTTRGQRVIPEQDFVQQPKAGEKFALPPVQKPAALASSGDTVVIKRLEFVGNTVFSQEELEATVAEYLNRDIHASDVETIRRKVSAFYDDHGYTNSGAVLKSQSLSSGVLKLHIIEGKLVEVRQSGQEGLPESYIRDRLIAGAGEPFNANDLQDSYRLLLGNPLIKKLNGQLLPGNRLGENIMDIKVTRARPYQLSFSTDNYQTPSVGEYAGRMGGWVDNLLSLGERVDAQFIATGGSLGYNTGIDLPLNAQDTRFSFRYSDTTSAIIEQTMETLGITNHVVGFDGGLSHPVYRTFADDLTLGLNFVVRQNRTELFGECQEKNSIEGIGLKGCDTQVTVLRMSQNYSHRGESSSAVFVSTFNAGLDALGATENETGSLSGQFFGWLGQGLFAQRLLDDGTQLVVKGNIQLVDTPVLSLERYTIGGVYTVRGYRENTYVRDNGFNTTVELHYPIYNADTEEKNNLQLVPFWDYGGVWNNPGVDDSRPATNYLFSAGIGFNWQYHQVSTDFYWAHAFTPVSNPTQSEHSIQDDGIHFRVNIDAF